MRHVHDTFYVLEDGTKADPNDVAVDDKGVLRHANGVAVALRGPGLPMTSGAGPATALMPEPKPNDDGGAVGPASTDDKKQPEKTADLKPAADKKTGYQTRTGGKD